MLTSLEDTFSGNALLLGTERVTAQGQPISKLENHVGLIERSVPFDGVALGFKSAGSVEFRRVETTAGSRRVKTTRLTGSRSCNGNGSRGSRVLSDGETGCSGVFVRFSGLADGGSREARRDVSDLGAAGDWQGRGEFLRGKNRGRDVGRRVRHFVVKLAS